MSLGDLPRRRYLGGYLYRTRFWILVWARAKRPVGRTSRSRVRAAKLNAIAFSLGAKKGKTHLV
jgi:hypothetical protein